MKSIKFQKKYLKKLIIAFLLLITTFFLFIILAPFFIKPYVKQIIQNRLRFSTNNLYSADFELSDISFIPGKVTLSNFKLKPNDEIKSQLHPFNYFDIESNQIELSGIRFHTYLWDGWWNIKNIKLHKAYIKVFNNDKGSKVSPKQNNKDFKLKVKQLEIIESKLEYWEENTNTKILSTEIPFGVLKKIKLKKNEPLDLKYSKIHFKPLKIFFKNKHLNLYDLYIEIEGKIAGIYANQLDVNEIYHSLDASDSDALNDLIKVEADSMAIVFPNYSLWPYLFKTSHHPYLVKRIFFKNPIIEISNKLFEKNSNSGFNFQSSKSLKYDIDNLYIENAQIIVRDSIKNRFAIKKVTLEINHLKQINHNKKVRIAISRIKLNIDSLYYQNNNTMIHCSNLDFINNGSELKVRNLFMKPLSNPDTFYLLKGYQIDYPILKIPEISFIGINHDMMLNSGSLMCNKIIIQNPVLYLFRDKNFPLNTTKRPDFPHKQLKQIEVPFYIDSISIKDGKIMYDEIAKESTDTGHFFMNNININTYRFTNLSDSLKKFDSLIFNFKGKFYAVGDLDGKLTLYVNSTYGLHKVEGVIGPMKAKLLNQITVPSANIQIKNGIVHGGNFMFKADMNHSEGELLLRFEKLKIAFLDSKKGESKQKVNKLKTFVANVFIVKENPIPGNDPVVSKIYYKRDPSRWVINYWWKSMLSGIDNIVLQRKNKMMEIKRDADKLKQMKKERKQK